MERLEKWLYEKFGSGNILPKFLIIAIRIFTMIMSVMIFFALLIWLAGILVVSCEVGAAELLWLIPWAVLLSCFVALLNVLFDN